MALAIKAIPTLYGEEAVRFRAEMERAEEEYDLKSQKEISNDSKYLSISSSPQENGMHSFTTDSVST